MEVNKITKRGGNDKEKGGNFFSSLSVCLRARSSFFFSFDEEQCREGESKREERKENEKGTKYICLLYLSMYTRSFHERRHTRRKQRKKKGFFPSILRRRETRRQRRPFHD
jgi:hypothetical protein